MRKWLYIIGIALVMSLSLTCVYASDYLINNVDDAYYWVEKSTVAATDNVVRHGEVATSQTSQDSVPLFRVVLDQDTVVKVVIRR